MIFADIRILNNFMRSFRSIIGDEKLKKVVYFNVSSKNIYFLTWNNMHREFIISGVVVYQYVE